MFSNVYFNLITFRFELFRNFENKFLVEKILVENYLSVDPGSGHKGKKISNFRKHVFFANWAI